MGVTMADNERYERLFAEMEKHLAFLEGALGIEMTPMFKSGDDALISELLADIEGLNLEAPFHLAFASPVTGSNWDEIITFDNLQELVQFLENVVLLFRIARRQQRSL
jgi:hypothetical protein